MSPVVLPIWLLLLPVVTYGLLAYDHRAWLGQRLSEPIGRVRPRVASLSLACVVGYLVFSGLYDMNERLGGVLDRTLTFMLLGAMAYLAAASAEISSRWVWTDLLARMMAEIGSLGYAAALVALHMQGDDGGLAKAFLLCCIFATWLLYHLARLAEPTQSARMSGASGRAP
jgi:hypothetical protein